MNFENVTGIKAAVDAGKSVYWKNPGYAVRKNNNGDYYIVFTANGSTVGLTHRDGVTMNENPADFFAW